MATTAVDKSTSAFKDERLSILLSLGALYFIWGSTYLAIRFAVETMPPYYMMAARFLLAGSVLYLFLRWRGRARPTASQWLGSALIGGLLLVGGVGSVSLAESLGVSSGMAAVVVSTMPLWYALFVRLTGDHIGRLEWLGMVVGLIGVGLLNMGTDLKTSPIATTLLFVAPISWALGSVWSRSLPHPDGLLASATEMLTAGAMFAVLGLVRGEMLTRLPSFSSGAALLYLVTFGSLLGYSAYIYLLSRDVRPTVLTSYTYVNPIIAVLLGVMLAGETVSASGLLGMGIVLIGVVLAVMAKAKPLPGSSPHDKQVQK